MDNVWFFKKDANMHLVNRILQMQFKHPDLIFLISY